MLVPAHMCEDAVITPGALSGVEPLANFFSCCSMSGSVSRWLWHGVDWGAKTACDWELVTKGVRWFLGLLGECPDVNVLFDGIPSQGGVPRGCLPKEVVIVDALLRRVVREEHHYECLVFGEL